MKNEKYLEYNVPVKIKLERVSVEYSICAKDDTETLEEIKQGKIEEYNIEVNVKGETYFGKGLWLSPDFKNIRDEMCILNSSGGIRDIVSDLLLEARNRGEL